VPTASLGIGFAQECLQALQLRLKGKRRIHLAAELFLLLLGRRQLAPARAEPRLPCPRLATGGSLGLAQFRAARLRRVRSRLFPVRTGVLALIQRQQVTRLAFRRGCGRKPSDPIDFVRRQVRCGKISVENDHALDDNAWLSVLPAPLRGLDSMSAITQVSDFYGSTEPLPVCKLMLGPLYGTECRSSSSRGMSPTTGCRNGGLPAKHPR